MPSRGNGFGPNLLITLALGGTWGGEIDDAVLPQKYVIDYVRVYAPAADR